MKICFIGFHKWKYYNRDIWTSKIEGQFQVSRKFRYCQNCQLNQRRYLGEWIDQELTEKEHIRESKIDKLLN